MFTRTYDIENSYTNDKDIVSYEQEIPTRFLMLVLISNDNDGNKECI